MLFFQNIERDQVNISLLHDWGKQKNKGKSYLEKVLAPDCSEDKAYVEHMKGIFLATVSGNSIHDNTAFSHSEDSI